MRPPINGEERDLADRSTLADLIASLGLAGRRVAVELNRDIVRADAWPERLLAEGDVVEIVHFVGGG